MPRGSPPRRDDVGFAAILGHDQQAPAVEALVAEVDDLRMAAVVFAQQRLRCFGKDPADGLQKAQRGAVVAGIDRVFGGDGLHAEPVGIRDDVGQLHRIADNHRIAGTHQRQRPCFGRHLRGFVHNHVVEERLRPEIRPRGEGRAQHDGVLLEQLGGDVLENRSLVSFAETSGQSAAQVAHRVVAQPGHHRRSVRRGKLLFDPVDLRRELLLPDLVVTALDEGDQPLEVLPLRVAGQSVEEAADPAFEQKPSDRFPPSVEESV